MEKKILNEYEELNQSVNDLEREEYSIKIEEVLSSKSRILILKILAEREELNISAIARITRINHCTANQHLEFLTKVGLIQEKKFGRIKIFRFCIENLKAKSLKRLFEIWE